MLGGAMLALGCGMLVFLTPTSSLFWPAAGAFLVGLGMGSCNTTYLVSVQAAAALRERGAATASNMFMRIVGQSTGAALFGALLNAGLIHFAALGNAEAMATSLRIVHIVAALGGVVVVLLALRLPARLNPRSSS
jgi:MFS family permease